jgi:hypothetical protein
LFRGGSQISTSLKHTATCVCSFQSVAHSCAPERNSAILKLPHRISSVHHDEIELTGLELSDDRCIAPLTGELENRVQVGIRHLGGVAESGDLWISGQNAMTCEYGCKRGPSLSPLVVTGELLKRIAK